MEFQSQDKHGIGLSPFCRITARVDPVVSLGHAAHGERRFVPIIGGTVEGEQLRGEVLAGGVDWQVQRADGTLEIAAHYVLRGDDGALIEIRSEGYRHGPPDVMQKLARGEQVPADQYYFRTAITFQTGSERWRHLNSLLAIGRGARTAGAALIDVFLVR
ncbi:DUF3237 domain-containing protein [Noviherbaspirillum aridicola]|uniref:UPF0311 protein NCCP691_03440 n=1 Tax=Noviherbaspirillum aridicola TaxID=2849687 RepID=A0ABQ4PZT0_9BURK|nr:DUF3237 domain-containing protein [Noviherbaspirillum aridicola]GIZ50330.1 UPF0311 protein [Noviherbaspirillum aridicola]